MLDYIANKNFERFESALEAEVDPSKIVILKDLLRIEKLKIVNLH